MAKAMLIIDMPSSCAECILGDDDSSGLYCVPKEEYVDVEDTTESRASFCPLVEVPKKKEEWDMDIIHHESLDLGKRIGYNACIDEILGGAEHG